MSSACIVGAGLAGLACAHRLRERGWSVTLIDKGRGPGGRCATRYLGDQTQRCDVGAQFWTARDDGFGAVTAGWKRHGWVERWGDGFPVLRAAGVQDGRDGHTRWRATGGMAALAKQVAAGLDVRSARTVTALTRTPTGWSVTHVAGDAIRGPSVGAHEQLAVNAVVLTQPLPQALAVLAPLGVAVPAPLAAVRYDPCLYLLAERADGPAVLAAPGGLRIEDPAIGATWLASARRRGLRTAGEGVILHADATVSATHWDSEPAAQVGALSEILQRILARLGATWTPEAAEVRRWKYSRCVQTVPEPCWQVLPGLLCAGDAFGAAPRIEGAWCSGRAAADAL